MGVFRRVNFAQEKQSMKDIYESLLDSSEDYLTKTIGQAIGMTGGHFPDELDPEVVSTINQALSYWKESKALVIQQAKIMDDRYEYLCKELQEQRKFLDQQATLLREQSRLLEEISKKKDR